MANSFVNTVPIFNALTGSLPCEGAKAMPFNCDFTAFSEFDFDLTTQFNQQQFTSLQGIFIDNADNTSQTIMVMGSTGQRIIAPAKSQGYYSLLMVGPPKFSIASAGAFVVPVQFLNFYIPPTVWLV